MAGGKRILDLANVAVTELDGLYEEDAKTSEISSKRLCLRVERERLQAGFREYLHPFGDSLKEAGLAPGEVVVATYFLAQKNHEDMLVELEKESKQLVLHRKRERESDIYRFRTRI